MEVTIIIKATNKIINEPLSGHSKNYFVVPESVILNREMELRRVSVFSFFLIRKGLDDVVTFSINNLVKWTSSSADQHKGRINDKYVTLLNQFVDMGYLTYSGKLTPTSCVEACFNSDMLSNECNNGGRFAILYLDEVETILKYKQNECEKIVMPDNKTLTINPGDSYLNANTLLLIFAYLRMKIYRRNKQSFQTDIASSPEAFNYFYYKIAKEIGVSSKTAAKAVYILGKLGLIYSEALPRIPYENRFRTDHTIFCNTYKREGGVLIASGSDYYKTEVFYKKKKLGI